MPVILGFARGGTHLFWCFIASHPDLQSRKEEINDLASLKNNGLLKKLILECFALSGQETSVFKHQDFNILDKAVTGWRKGLIFNILRRYDPSKYLKTMGFYGDKIIFL